MRAWTTTVRTLGLVLAGPVLTGCVTVIGLQPTPVLTTTPLVATADCPEAGGALSCLEAGQPNLRLELAANEEVLWFKVSPDGRTAVLSLAPRGYLEMRTWQATFVAFDLEAQQELWRLKLSPDVTGQAEDCYFIGEDKIAFLTTWSELIALDRGTGAEAWRITGPPALPKDSIHLAHFDAEHGFFLLSGLLANYVVDAGTGQVLSSKPRTKSDYTPQRVGGRPYVTDGDVYLYDYGILRLPRDDKKVAWHTSFVTFAEDDKTGANIGMAILGALVGAQSSIPPDYFVGRTVEPVMSGGRLVVGAMGVVHAVDPDSGAIAWSQDLAVPAIATIEPYQDRLFVVAGGYAVDWLGDGQKNVVQPVRYGLYCLRAEDGMALESFQSPFNLNAVHRTLDPALRAAYDQDDAWEKEEDWAGDDSKARAKLGANARLPHSATRLVDACLIDPGLLVATATDVMVLDAETGQEIKGFSLSGIGELRALRRVGQWVVARAADGVAVIDATTGEVAWSTQVEPPPDWQWYLDPGAEPFLDLPERGFMVSVEQQFFAKSLLWTCGATGVVLVPSAGPSLLGLRLADGEVAFELPVGVHTRVVRQDDQLVINSLEGSTVSIYRVPRSL